MARTARRKPRLGFLRDARDRGKRLFRRVRRSSESTHEASETAISRHERTFDFGNPTTWPSGATGAEFEETRTFKLGYRKHRESEYHSAFVARQADKLAGELDDLAASIAKNKLAIKLMGAKFALWLVSCLKVKKGKLAEVQSSAQARITKTVQSYEAGHDVGSDEAPVDRLRSELEEQLARFIAKIRERATELIVKVQRKLIDGLDDEVGLFGCKIRPKELAQQLSPVIGAKLEEVTDPASLADKVVELLFQKAQDLLVDSGALWIFETAQGELDQLAADVEARSNGQVQLFLGADSESTDPRSVALMKEVSKLLGLHGNNASAAAECLSSARAWAHDTAEADVHARVIDDYGAELEGKASAQGSSLIEAAGFIDGIQVLFNTEAIAYIGGKLFFSRQYQFTDAFKAQVATQLDAYAQAGGRIDFAAKFSLLEGLDITGSASAQALAVASASGEITLNLGTWYVEAKGRLEARAGVEAKAQGQIKIAPDGTFVLEGSANFELGASVTASGSVDGKYFKITGSIGASAGLSGEVTGGFSIEGGKLKIKLDIGAALGIGLLAGAEVEIDLKPLIELLLRKIEVCLLEKWLDHRCDSGAMPFLRSGRASLAHAAAREAVLHVKPPDPRKWRSKYKPDLHFVRCLDAVTSYRIALDSDAAFRESVLDMARALKEEHFRIRTTRGLSPDRGFQKKVDSYIDVDDRGLRREIAEREWDHFRPAFNDGLATWIGEVYGGLFLVSYNDDDHNKASLGFEVASALPTANDVLSGRIIGLPERAPSPPGVVDQATLSTYGKLEDPHRTQVIAQDLRLWSELVKAKGVNMSTRKTLKRSMGKLSRRYWKQHPAYAAMRADKAKFKDQRHWFESNALGGQICAHIAAYMNDYCGSQFVLGHMARKRDEYMVEEIGVNDHEVRLRRWAFIYRGTWKAYFSGLVNDHGRMDLEQTDLREAILAHTVGIDIMVTQITRLETLVREWRGSVASGRDLRLVDVPEWTDVQGCVQQLSVTVGAPPPTNWVAEANVHFEDVPTTLTGLKRGLEEWKEVLRAHIDGTKHARMVFKQCARDFKLMVEGDQSIGTWANGTVRNGWSLSLQGNHAAQVHSLADLAICLHRLESAHAKHISQDRSVGEATTFAWHFACTQMLLSARKAHLSRVVPQEALESMLELAAEIESQAPNWSLVRQAQAIRDLKVVATEVLLARDPKGKGEEEWFHPNQEPERTFHTLCRRLERFQVAYAMANDEAFTLELAPQTVRLSQSEGPSFELTV